MHLSKIIIILAMAIFSSSLLAEEKAKTKPKKPRFEHNIIKETFHFDSNSLKNISLDELRQGCPKIDCIPSIDKPKFVSADEAKFLNDKDVVILVNYKGISRAYSLNILQSHEIVNDWFGATPIAVTYCPLCGSAVAIKRTLDGQDVEFGVSGVLHNSDLVMYDRKSKSLWGQITGKAIVGPKTGQKLKKISAQMLRWGSVKKNHPKVQVLSTDTGFEGMDYTKQHYGDYATSDRLFMPVPLKDARLHIKDVVYGVEYEGESIAFEEGYLKKNPDTSFKLAGKSFTIHYKGEGMASTKFADSGEEIATTHVYWFAWFNFHPKTSLRSSKI